MISNIKKGFTLIELLVVISVIGVLTSIVIVEIRKGVKKAENASIVRQMQ